MGGRARQSSVEPLSLISIPRVAAKHDVTRIRDHSCALMSEAERQTLEEEVRAMGVADATWDVVSAHAHASACPSS